MNDSTSAPPVSEPADYPADLERSWLPAGSTPVTIRALRPDDLDRELAFAAGLSEQTLHLRLQYTRKGITREGLHAFIQGLKIPDPEKQRLLAMTPWSYVGKAAELAKRI